MDILITVPTGAAGAFAQHWKELRLAEALDPEHDLRDAVEIENFDGATVVQWALQLTDTVSPLITGVFGYLIAARGELEFEKDGEKMRFKNLKPSKIKEVLAILDERKGQ